MSRATAFESRTDWNEASATLSRRGTARLGCADANSYFPPPRCEMTEEKARLLAAAISQIEKDHGKGAIMRLGSRDILVPVSVIPSGCLSIDEALVRSGGVDIGVVDSVAALVPKEELEGEMGDPQMGLQARLMSQALRKLTGIVSKSRTCLIFINQIREKIGVMFGNPETTTGGRALKFYASMRVDIRRIQAIKEGDKVVGSRTRAKVVKNKVAAPFREAEFDIVYGEGISREGDLIDLGVDKGVLEKSGTWISFGGERMGQGRENARVFLKENKDIRDKLENVLRKKLEIPVPGNSNAAAPGPNGHAASAQPEKPPMKTSAATAGAEASKARPTR